MHIMTKIVQTKTLCLRYHFLLIATQFVSVYKQSIVKIRFSNSISLTETKSSAWWKLTFTKVYYINMIKIWARQDRFPERISKLSVNIGTTQIGKVTYVKNKAAYTFGKLGALGKQVIMKAHFGNQLQLAEVGVFGGDLGKLKLF